LPVASRALSDLPPCAPSCAYSSPSPVWCRRCSGGESLGLCRISRGRRCSPARSRDRPGARQQAR
jgi:hypothetical protein